MKSFGSFYLAVLVLFALVSSDAQLTKWTATGADDIATILGYTPASTASPTFTGGITVTNTATTQTLAFQGFSGQTNDVVKVGSGGTNYWRFDKSGNLLAAVDNVYNIGASGATRPLNIFASGTVSGTGFSGNLTVPSAAVINGANERLGSAIYLGWSSAADNSTVSDTTMVRGGAAGVITLGNAASPTDFGRLQFGGTSASFPSIKRSTTNIVVRLADDSADAGVQAAYVLFGTNILSFSGTSLTWNGQAITVP